MSVILITGANKGLGYETARHLIGEGHTVYIGARSAGRGEKAAAELGGRFVQLDVTDDQSVETALESIREQEGRLDVLINNAGIWDGAVGVEGVTGATALREFDTNVVGVVRVTQAALRRCYESQITPLLSMSPAALARSGRSPTPNVTNQRPPSLCTGRPRQRSRC